MTADQVFCANLLAKDRCESVEEANRFIEIIAHKHQSSSDYRGLICGTLRHLSANLYTSPVHFLSEIIQNFEDNVYDLESKPWYLRIVLAHEYLLFSSNEVGFTPNNVRSMCSLAESTKKIGEHIGHKGLGFKSVFLCTDNPVIISRPFWSFGFERLANEDEMAYITPKLVDLSSSRYASLKTEVDAQPNSCTFLYLPLKDDYKYTDSNSRSRGYFDQIVENVDSHVLLFTKKLEKIVIDNRINGRLSEMTCERHQASCGENALISPNRTRTFESSIRIEMKEENGELSNRTSKFLICQREVQIPDDLAREEHFGEGSHHMTEITLGFPHASLVQADTTFPVFAFLPVCDVGLRFIVNCYWSLVTSRESINEHSSLNAFYADQIAKLFEWAANNEQRVRDQLHLYLPRVVSHEMSSWWRLFITDIKLKLKPIVGRVFGADADETEMTVRVYNDSLADLIEDEQALKEGAGYKLIHPSRLGQYVIIIQERYYLFIK